MTDDVYTVEGTSWDGWEQRTTDARDLLTRIMTWPNPIFEPVQIPAAYDMRPDLLTLSKYLEDQPGPWLLTGYSYWGEPVEPWADMRADVQRVIDECNANVASVFTFGCPSDRYDLPYGYQEESRPGD